ncbi:hypothetical protein D3C87_2056900 [compost metagenome]
MRVDLGDELLLFGGQRPPLGQGRQDGSQSGGNTKKESMAANHRRDILAGFLV